MIFIYVRACLYVHIFTRTCDMSVYLYVLILLVTILYSKSGDLTLLQSRLRSTVHIGISRPF